MVVFKINEKIYYIPIIFVIGSWEERCQYLKEKENIKIALQRGHGGDCELFEDNNGHSLICIWLPEFDYNVVEYICALQHEIDHAIFFILGERDIPILAGEENHAYIYLKEYFTNQALKRLKKECNNDN